MIPLDLNNISPTVQLLYDDENEHYSSEANKAAMAAGLEDVKIEYYASPQQNSSQSNSQPSSANKKSINSVYGTPLGANGLSGSCSTTSFYTPTGEDKENLTPASSARNQKYGSHKKSDKYVADINIMHETKANNSNGSGQRGVLSEMPTDRKWILIKYYHITIYENSSL